jgi:hypothetical protein
MQAPAVNEGIRTLSFESLPGSGKDLVPTSTGSRLAPRI